MALAMPVYRRAVDADIPAMAAIRLGVTENRLRDPSRVTPAMYRDFLDRDGRGWVAQVDGVIAGFCYANRVDGSIWALFVDPAHEGRGIARQLLGLATDWLFLLGFACVTLETGAGTRADRFYSRQGWQRSELASGEAHYLLERPVRT